MTKQKHLLTGEAQIKEVCHLIRVVRSDWEALHHAACRGERDRSEEYFRAHRTPL